MSMQSRRDLFQAHRLMTQRASLALLRGEPDVPDQPLRRLNVATFSGVLVAVIVVGVFGIWGLIFHGGASLAYSPGTLVIDKSTGTNFVFCEKNKDLCPVLNYTSARLILQAGSPTVDSVNSSQIGKFGQGPLIGIPGLPADLPSQSQLVSQPWSVCAQTSIVNGTGAVTSTTLAGGIGTNGQALGTTALAVRSQGQDWVIWHNQRMPITGTVLSDAFSLSGSSLPSVPLVWLNAIPQSSAFQAPAIAGQSGNVSGPAGQAVVGQTYKVVVASSTRYYVLLDNGQLAPITQLQDTLLSFEQGAPPQQSLPPSAVNGRVAAAIPTGGLPTTMPQAASADEAGQAGQTEPFCVVYSGKAGGSLSMQVETGGTVPQNGIATGAASGSGTVESVALPDASGALVKETGDNISYFLITDGHRYAMASNQVPAFLGYTASTAVQLPASLVDLIPAGPGLNPAQANDTVTAGTTG
jgi:type VII secretion protein EccB